MNEISFNKNGKIRSFSSIRRTFIYFLSNESVSVILSINLITIKSNKRTWSAFFEKVFFLNFSK